MPDQPANLRAPMPASPVLTAIEAAAYLRLDINKTAERAVAAINYLVDEKKLLRPLTYGARRLYHRDELDRFLRDRQE